MRSDIIACYPFRFGAAFPAGYGRPVLPLQLQRLPNETHICWCEMCAERGTPRSLRLPTIPYSLTFMWWRTRTDKVCCYAFSRVGRVRHQTNARNLYSLSLSSAFVRHAGQAFPAEAYCVYVQVYVYWPYPPEMQTWLMRLFHGSTRPARTTPWSRLGAAASVQETSQRQSAQAATQSTVPHTRHFGASGDFAGRWQ